MKHIRLKCILLFLSGLSALPAQDTTQHIPLMEIRGYLKDLQSVYFVDDVSNLNSSNLIHNRLNFKFNFSPAFSARLELRNRIFWGEQVKSIPEFGTIIDQYNGYVSLSKLWIDEPGLVIHSVIDRMVVQYTTHRWDVRVGRQRINWGVNTIWNPNDIFNAYNFLDFDYAERPGNDAIRIQHFFKNNNAAEIAWRIGKNKDENIAAVMYRFNTSKYDIQIMGGVYNADYVIGGGWAGNIKDAGFKGEASYFHPQVSINDTTGTLSLSVMADQTFKNDWYVSASMLYNSNPSDDPTDNLGIYNPELSAKSLSPYRYTYYAGVMKSLSPITSLSLAVIYSPTNTSLILYPTFTWNVANNFDVGLIAQSSFSKVQGSYSTQGNAFYLSARWSF